MELKEIIKIADSSYPDGLIGQYFEARGTDQEESLGDGLARFICMEICDTYDESASNDDQFSEAIRVVSRAREELQAVQSAFEQAQRFIAACRA